MSQPARAAAAASADAGDGRLRALFNRLRNHRVSRRLVLGTLASVGLVVCLFLGIVGFQAIQNVHLVVVTTSSLCTDLTTHNYSHAYTLLDSSLQRYISADYFVSLEHLADRHEGLVRSCAQMGDVTIQQTHAKLSLQIKRIVATSGTLLLVKQGDAWRIDAVAGALQLV